MKRIHSAVIFALAVVLAAGTAGCSAETVAEPDEVGVAEELPQDTNGAQSKKVAKEFRAWAEESGTARQKDAVGRVQRILGEWDESTGSAYISTDINGGRTPVSNPQATASTIVEAFADWRDSDQGFASVYDVFGNAMITNRKF